MYTTRSSVATSLVLEGDCFILLTSFAHGKHVHPETPSPITTIENIFFFKQVITAGSNTTGGYNKCHLHRLIVARPGGENPPILMNKFITFSYEVEGTQALYQNYRARYLTLIGWKSDQSIDLKWKKKSSSKFFLCG